MNSRMPILLSLSILLTFPVPSSAHDGNHAPSPDSQVAPQAQPAVRVVEQFSTALQVGDLKQAGSLLADDVLILESGGAERSREEYLGHHAVSDAAFLKGAHVQVKQRTVRVDGNLAWVGTESELHTSKDGKPLTLLSTETMVLRKVEDRWRIAHIHWSSRTKPSTKQDAF